MSTDRHGTQCRRNTAENYNRLSRVDERYRQTTDRQTDGRQQIGNVNVRQKFICALLYNCHKIQLCCCMDKDQQYVASANFVLVEYIAHEYNLTLT